MPNIALVIGGVGIASLIAAILLVANHNVTQASLVTHPTSVSEQAASTNISGSKNGVNNTKSNTTSSPNHGAVAQSSTQTKTSNTAPGSNASNTSSSRSTGSSTQAAAATPRSGYNLNENWYFSSVGAAGDYNTCWPTEITLDNEASCLDPSNAYSGVMFEGIGVSKSASEAQQLAASQLDQKLAEKHIVPRRGGGGDAVILTEDICASYGLSCGRW